MTSGLSNFIVSSRVESTICWFNTFRKGEKALKVQTIPIFACAPAQFLVEPIHDKDLAL